jgi:hypothetical protein
MRMIELDENDELLYSSSSGYMWRIKFRSYRRLIQQHETLRRTIEGFYTDVWRRSSNRQRGVSQIPLAFELFPILSR